MDKLLALILLVLFTFATFTYSNQSAENMLSDVSSETNSSSMNLKDKISSKDLVVFSALRELYNKGVVIEVTNSGAENGIYAIANSLDEPAGTLAFPITITSRSYFKYNGSKVKRDANGTTVRVYVERATMLD